MESKLLKHCDQIGCLNHAKIYLMHDKENGAIGISLKPTNIHLSKEENPIGILLTCLFCEDCKKTDMFVKSKSAIIETNH